MAYICKKFNLKNTMRKGVYLFSFIAMSLFTFCTSNDDSNNDNQAKDNAIEINNDITSLSKRLDYTNSGVLSITGLSAGKFSKSAESSTNSLPLVQIAEVNPPTDSNGKT
jgi:hypothetical protein